MCVCVCVRGRARALQVPEQPGNLLVCACLCVCVCVCVCGQELDKLPDGSIDWKTYDVKTGALPHTHNQCQSKMNAREDMTCFNMHCCKAHALAVKKRLPVRKLVKLCATKVRFAVAVNRAQARNVCPCVSWLMISQRASAVWPMRAPHSTS